MRFLAAYIMQGRLQAMTVASTLALLSLLFPPFSMVSAATVALVGLRLGAKEGLYVLLCSCLAAGVLSQVLLGDMMFALAYASVLWLPVWVIAIILREGRRPEVAMEAAVALGMLMVLGFFWLQPDPAEYWRGIMMQMFQPMLDSQPDMPQDVVQSSVRAAAVYVTGGVAAGSALGLIMGVLLARWWQSDLYNPGGFRTEFLALRPHRNWAYAWLALAAVGYAAPGVTGEISLNLLVVLSVLYLLTGVAVLHSLFAGGKNAQVWLAVFYITLFTIPHVMPIVAFSGLADAWLDLRNKFKFDRGN